MEFKFLNKPYTEAELKIINDLIEEALMTASGVLPLTEKEKTDTTGWTREQYEEEIKRIKQNIKSNMNAFGVQKIKVNNEEN